MFVVVVMFSLCGCKRVSFSCRPIQSESCNFRCFLNHYLNNGDVDVMYTVRPKRKKRQLMTTVYRRL